MAIEEDNVARCDECKTGLYRLIPKERGFPGIGAPPGAEMTVKPIVVVIGRELQLLFCSKTCCLWWFERTPEKDLKIGGYPL